MCFKLTFALLQSTPVMHAMGCEEICWSVCGVTYALYASEPSMALIKVMENRGDAVDLAMSVVADFPTRPAATLSPT